MVIKITPKYNLIGIIAAIGALAMIVGVFLSWVDLSGAATSSIMGWDISSHSSYSGTTYSYVPMVTLVCGIVVLAIAVLEIMGLTAKWDMIMDIIAIIIAVIAIAVILLFNGDIVSSFGTDTITAATGMGVWVSLAGSIIVAVFGAYEIFKEMS